MNSFGVKNWRISRYALPAILLGLAVSGSSCGWQSSQVEAYAPDLRVFDVHENPRFVIDFVAPDGSQIREPLMTDARPFAIEGDEVFFFQGKKVLRGIL